jgi:3-hydroxyacyl-[acyl-carrier-protein] dehydratase
LELDISQVKELLPHRYPFLLIDRVIDMKPGESLSALKNVSVNEPFFQGHFPGLPIMPGVLIIESLAQAISLLAFHSLGEGRDSRIFMLVGIDKARFRGQVVPGDQLILKVSMKRNMRGVGVYQCRAMVEDNVVVEAEIMCSVQDRRE